MLTFVIASENAGDRPAILYGLIETCRDLGELHLCLIRHHDKRGQLLTLPVEVPQCIGDDSGVGGMLQQARPAALIQPFVDLLRKALVVLVLCLFVPRQWIVFHPRLPLRFPLIQFRPQQGIGQSPRDENPCLALRIEIGARNGGRTFLSPILQAAGWKTRFPLAPD
ncbi:MAG: hypothetical protein LR011_09565 [Verrucomicrobia bacterium]|nr:hypothetical protein [Verrucomicrobiota bacterium]